MAASEHSQIHTRQFARVLGPLLTIVVTTVVVRGPYVQALFGEFTNSAIWWWLFAAILLKCALVIIAFHQYWQSPAAVIISLWGWFGALQGALLLYDPQAYYAAIHAIYGSGTAVIWVLAAIGLYLTYVGWRPTHPRPKDVISLASLYPVPNFGRPQ